MTLDYYPTRLASYSPIPTPLTRFIGRTHEIAEIKELLTEARLLTLIGAGGSGKTRLALRVVDSLTASFEDGVGWVDLEALTDPALIPQVVAHVLGIHELPTKPLIQLVSSGLRDRHVLLVLDHCEHMSGACRELVETLLLSAPDVQMLIVSREPLGVAGEIIWPVPSLSIPVADWHGDTSSSDLLQYDALSLFVERAQSALPGFRLKAQNADFIVQICRRLDGSPLAIELAAAKIRVLTVEQIAARLDDLFTLLNSVNRNPVNLQHQTLRATVDWSYDLLADKERILLRRLSVFMGGFVLDSAETICAGDGIERNEIFSLLEALVDRSLVLAETQVGSEARYRLLEIIRQYASMKLSDAEEMDGFQQRHLEYFCTLAEAAEVGLRTSEQAVWLERVEVEHDNLRFALTRAQSMGKPEWGMRLAGALGRFWDIRGYLREGSEWLEQTLQLGAGDSSSIRAKTLHVAGTFAFKQGNYTAAETMLAESLAIRRQGDDQRGVAASLNNLASVKMNQGDFATAKALLEESTVIKSEIEDLPGAAYALNNLGEIARHQGDFVQAAALYNEGLSIHRALDNKEHLATTIYNLGSVSLALGDYEQAAALFEESITLAKLLGYQGDMILCVAKLSALLRVTGKLEAAARLSGVVDAQMERIGFSMEPIDRADYDQHLSVLRSALDEATWVNVRTAGRAMTLEQAAEDALILASEFRAQWRAPATLVKSEKQPALRIFALGNIRVFRGTHQLMQSEWTYAKSRELLFYLLSHQQVSKKQIGLDLWPDASPEQLRSNFRVTLHYLRRALGQSKWIVFEKEHYTFNRSLAYSYDVETFENYLTQAKQPGIRLPERIELLTQAIKLYRGEFLINVDTGDWYLVRREELRRRFLDAGLELGRLLFAQTRYADAADVYRTLITQDSYLEAAHRELMRCYSRQGERGQALRHYQVLADLMQTELGLSPSSETLELYEQLSRGETL